MLHDLIDDVVALKWPKDMKGERPLLARALLALSQEPFSCKSAVAGLACLGRGHYDVVLTQPIQLCRRVLAAGMGSSVNVAYPCNGRIVFVLANAEAHVSSDW